jgi:hypothetical protein
VLSKSKPVRKSSSHDTQGSSEADLLLHASHVAKSEQVADRFGGVVRTGRTELMGCLVSPCSPVQTTVVTVRIHPSCCVCELLPGKLEMVDLKTMFAYHAGMCSQSQIVPSVKDEVDGLSSMVVNA